MGDLYMHTPRGAQDPGALGGNDSQPGSFGAAASGAMDAATLGQAARVLQSPAQQPQQHVPDISPMVNAVQHLQANFGVSPEASAVLTRALFAPVMSHPEMQRWLNLAYPQPQTPGPKTPQEAASRLAQMALLFGQR